mmetsp:Transcript_106172/g.300396  ORF Transcript_106172/g.300396 Transcript_106172/m.300396 type:complete len:253 (-) Transcript_106172:903-1661(-)
MQISALQAEQEAKRRHALQHHENQEAAAHGDGERQRHHEERPRPAVGLDQAVLLHHQEREELDEHPVEEVDDHRRLRQEPVQRGVHLRLGVRPEVVVEDGDHRPRAEHMDHGAEARVVVGARVQREVELLVPPERAASYHQREAADRHDEVEHADHFLERRAAWDRGAQEGLHPRGLRLRHVGVVRVGLLAGVGVLGVRVVALQVGLDLRRAGAAPALAEVALHVEEHEQDHAHGHRVLVGAVGEVAHDPAA